MPVRRSLRHAAGVGAVGLIVISCTDDDASVPTTPPPTVTTTTEPPRLDDGVLRIGLLLPESGEGATIGQPLIDAAVLAATQINAAGGVLGQSVDIIEGFDEGNSVATARDSIAALIDRDVDAVVGPASSTIALATLGDLLAAGVLTCSPTATTLALDDFPESDLFFRTAPSDTLQASAIAQIAEGTGARNAVVTFVDDTYGRPLAEATITALAAAEVTTLERVPFAANEESLVDEATAISEQDVGVVVVIGDGEHGTRMLFELGEVAGLFPGGDTPLIIVNDAIRRPPSTQLVQELPPDVRQRIVGVSPKALGVEPEEPIGAFATNAYDCVNLIALSAVQATSDDPAEMAAQMVAVSSGGVICTLFAECIDQLGNDNNIDYDGPGGGVEIGAEGDPVRARFDRFSFDDAGVDVSTGAPMLIAT